MLNSVLRISILLVLLSAVGMASYIHGKNVGIALLGELMLPALEQCIGLLK